MASASLPIPDHNKGFRMLQRMGWKGAGLGREEHGGSYLHNTGYNMHGWDGVSTGGGRILHNRIWWGPLVNIPSF